MRIWNEDLIPKLCRQHLLACWREGLGCYKIITENKKGYRNHPQVKEFSNATATLYKRLELVRSEMLKRGYKPKELPQTSDAFYGISEGEAYWYYENKWQTLEEQIAILKSKKCECKV